MHSTGNAFSEKIRSFLKMFYFPHYVMRIRLIELERIFDAHKVLI